MSSIPDLGWTWLLLAILAYVLVVALILPLFAPGSRADDAAEAEFWERRDHVDPPRSFHVLDVHRGRAFDQDQDGAA